MGDGDGTFTALTSVADGFGRFFTMLAVLAASFSMIFLFGYLSVFDVSLIITIEYSDILKLMLIGVVVVYGLVMISIGLIQTYLNWMKSGISGSIFFIAVSVIAIVPIFSLGLAIYRKEYIEYQAHYLITFGAGLGFLACLALYYKKELVDFSDLVYLVVIMAFFSASLGKTYGLYVKDFGALHNLTVRDDNSKEQTISGARLILFTSHHLILQTGTTIVTVPTANVQQMTSSAE